MKIVIDISAEDFEKVKCGRGAVSMMRKAIIHGTPLPKGHGRLIDADALYDEYVKEPEEFNGGAFNHGVVPSCAYNRRGR